MAKKATLVLKKASTYPVDIAVNVPGLMSGQFIGHAKPRSRDALEKLQTDIAEKKFSNDAEVIREIYKSFEGVPAFTKFDSNGKAMVDANGEPVYVDEDQFGTLLEGEDAFKEVTEGHCNTWLIPSAMKDYFQSFDASRGKNSGPLRGR